MFVTKFPCIPLFLIVRRACNADCFPIPMLHRQSIPRHHYISKIAVPDPVVFVPSDKYEPLAQMLKYCFLFLPCSLAVFSCETFIYSYLLKVMFILFCVSTYSHRETYKIRSKLFSQMLPLRHCDT